MAEATPEQLREYLTHWEAQGDVVRANRIRHKLGMPMIDEEQGAPAGVRAAAGASRGAGAVQQSLENFYPGQVTPFGTDNFLIPGENGPTPYNPPGMDWGDAAQYGRLPIEMVGALLGGTAGVPGGIPGVLLGAGLGGETAGQAYDQGMQRFFGAEDTRDVGQQLTDTAMGVAANSMGGPVARPAHIGAELAEDAVMRAASNEVGLPPLTPAQRGNRLAERVEGGLEGTLFGGPPINAQRESVGDAVNRYVDSIWPAPVSRQEAGASAVAGAEQSATALRGEITRLYDEVDALIDTSGRIDVPASRQLLEEIDAKAARDPAYAGLVNQDPQLTRYLTTLREATQEATPPRISAGGQPVSPPALPPYETVKQFRTNVGEALDSPFTASQPGSSMPEKRRLYATLSDDMEAGATQLGGPDAAAAARRASAFNRDVMARLEKVDPIFKNADNPTRVYEVMSSRVMSDPKMVSEARRLLPDGAWEDFVTRYVRDTLAATPGAENAAGNAVSFSTIATNLNKLKRRSPEGYDLIAGGNRRALDNLQVIANRLRENERFFNKSRTGNVNSLGAAVTPAGAGGMGYLMSGDPMKAAALAGVGLFSASVVPWMAAKALTSPTFQEALQGVARSDIANITSLPQLGRALIAAGADEAEVAEMLQLEGALE